jgi:WD40 repeat protein
VASGSADGISRVWEAANGREVAKIAQGVWTIRFSPDGRWVASGGYYETVQIWEAASGQEVAQMAHEGAVTALAFSPDGRWLVTGSDDGTARVWLWRPEDLIREACTRLPRNLTPQEWQMYLPDEPCRPTCPNLPDLCTAPSATPTPMPSP